MACFLLQELSLATGNDLPEASCHLVLARNPQAVLLGLSPSQWQEKAIKCHAERSA